MTDFSLRTTSARRCRRPLNTVVCTHALARCTVAICVPVAKTINTRTYTHVREMQFSNEECDYIAFAFIRQAHQPEQTERGFGEMENYAVFAASIGIFDLTKNGDIHLSLAERDGGRERGSEQECGDDGQRRHLGEQIDSRFVFRT